MNAMNNDSSIELLEKTLARMPDTIDERAPQMALRIVEGTQQCLARNAHLPEISYCSLLMKLGAKDVIRELTAELRSAAAQVRASVGNADTVGAAGLSLAPVGEEDRSLQALQKSSELFARIAAGYGARGLKGVEAYATGFFLGPLRQALTRSRIDDTTSSRIMPYACEALDAELLRLYEGFAAQMR
jgi:hypothetical protein